MRRTRHTSVDLDHHTAARQLQEAVDATMGCSHSYDDSSMPQSQQVLPITDLTTCVQIYSIASALALYSLDAALLIDTVRDLYEAFVI